MGEHGTMQTSKARAIGSGVLAMMALIATVCVLDGNMIKEEDHYGNNQLENEAKALNAERDALSAGYNVASVFDSLHQSSEPKEDKDFTEVLEAAAPHKTDLDVALSPTKLGLIKYHNGKAYLTNPTEDNDSDNEELIQWQPEGQDGLSAQIESAKDADDQADLKEEDLEDDFLVGNQDTDEEDEMFLQVTDNEWKPSGQSGLDSAIEAASANDEEAAIKADGLKGTGLLSSAGIDSEETMLMQMSDSEWKPTGQEDLATALSAARDSDEADQIKADGLKGTSMLSAAGIHDGAEDEEEEAPETFFLQEPTAWTPSGQAGMTEQIESAEESDEQAEIKADGLKGQSVLSAAAIDEDEDEEMIQEWTPVGQKVTVQTYEDHEQEKDTDPWNTPDDGLDGNDILSAVGMENHKKTDSDEEGLISAEDLGLDNLLDN